MTTCTHGQPLWHHLAVGDICPVCRTTIVAVAAPPADGHRGEVAPEATTQASLEVPLPATIAAGVAPCRKDGDGPPPVPPAPAATIATPAPTTATPCPALRLPVATRSANAQHGAGVAPSLFDVLTEPPHARTTDPETAHDAAHQARHRAAADRELVLRAHHQAGERGLTGDELEQVTGRAYQSIGPRRPALVERKWLVRTDVRRPNRKGNPESVYTITPAGIAAVAALRGATAA